MVIVLGIDPGLANTGYGVVARDGARLRALDGGVIETQPKLALERRLAKIAAASARAARRVRMRRDGAGAVVLRPERAQRLCRRTSTRSDDAGGRRTRYPLLLLHAATSQVGGMRQWSRRQGAGGAYGANAAGAPRYAEQRSRLRCSGCGRVSSQRHAAFRRCGQGGSARGEPGMIALVRGEVAIRRSDHVVLLCGGVGYRMAVSSETLAPRAGRRRGEHPAHAPGGARRRAALARLSLRAGARPVPDAAFSAGRWSEGGGGGALQRLATRAAVRDRRRRRRALSGGARDRQAHGRAHHRRAAREGGVESALESVGIVGRADDGPRRSRTRG